MTIRLLAILSCSVLVACTASPDPALVRDPTIQMEQEAIEKFRTAHAGDKPPPRELPKLGRTEIQQVIGSQRIATFGDLRLELQLGERWTAGTRSAFRSESRYRLLDSKSRLLASAESMIARQDTEGPDKTGRVVCLWDEDAQTVFIAEEQSWATHRYVLIRPKWEGELPGSGSPAAWTVSYVHIPRRGSPYPPPVLPRFLGIRDGKLFVQQDGDLYAFPFHMFEEDDDLEYGMG